LSASEGHYSPEIETLRLIDRFGIEAVTGRRQFYYGELRRMVHAENIVNAYNSRKQSENWAEWVHKYPQAAEMLAEAEKLCH
jgi:hypothetical protein